MSKTLEGFKSRINAWVSKSVDLENDETGSYALFYFIGKDIERKFNNAPSKVLDKELITYLIDHEVTIVVKSGTLSNRKSGGEPYKLRLREIQSSLAKLFNGKNSSADRATKKAYDALINDDYSLCFMTIVALDVFLKDDNTFWMEDLVKDHIYDTYGLVVGNDSSTRVESNMCRWGTKKLPIIID